MKVLNKDILMEEHAKVDGRDLSKDGKVLDDATSQNIPATLVKRDNAGFSALTVSEAEKLKSKRRISLVGDITGSAYFDGTSSINIQTRYINNRLDNYYPKPYIDDNFYRVSLRIDEIKNVVDSWKIEILRSGLGINYFTYNGTSEASISIDFQDISETSGTSTQVSRADHTHDNVYIKKTDIPNLKLEKDDYNIKLTNLDGSAVYSEIKVPYALSLGFENGSKGYPLNSTELNNEPDKVVRTSSDGSVQFGEISTITNLVDDFEYVYVDSGDSKIRRTLKDNIYNHIYDYIDNNYLNNANKLFFENENQRCMSIENGVLKANDSTPLVIDNADKWTSQRKFNFNGVVTGSALVDGSANVNFPLAFNSNKISYPLEIDTKGKLIYEPYSRGWGTKNLNAPFIQNNIDLNTVLDNGFYHIVETTNSNLNRPSNKPINLVVYGYEGRKVQVAYCFFENDVDNNKVFVRSQIGSNWAIWKELGRNRISWNWYRKFFNFIFK